MKSLLNLKQQLDRHNKAIKLLNVIQEAKKAIERGGEPDKIRRYELLVEELTKKYERYYL